MKHIKKTVMIFMILLFIAGTATYSTTVDAARKSSKKVTYTLNNGTLTISGKGKMPPSMTFKGNKEIKTVVIKKGVTSISNNAFKNCKNMTKVTIPSSVKSIGRTSFYGTGIKSLKVPAKVKKIGWNAFGNCRKLKNL